MSVNWQHVDQQEPKKDQVILVIDSWNIAENDEKAQFKDNGHDSQTFLSLRVAYFDEIRQEWVANSNEQFVRFKYYVPITIPILLQLKGFKFKDADIQIGE